MTLKKREFTPESGSIDTYVGLQIASRFVNTNNDIWMALKRGYIEFKHYTDAIHSGLTPAG